MNRKSIVIFFTLAAISISCQKKERDMNYIKQEMTEMGYDGTFREPKGTLERAAINLLGIDEMLIFEGVNDHLVILQFRSANDEEIRSKIESVITFLEPYLSPEDIKNVTNAKEYLDTNSEIHNNMMLVWQNEKPDDILKLIKRNF